MYGRSFRVRKTHVVSFVVGVVLAAAVGAAAAWVVFNYTGASGSTTQQFDTSSTQTVGALSYSSTGPGAPALAPGSETTIPMKVVNNDPAVAHALTGNLTFAITSNPAHCADHLTMADTGSVNWPLTVAAGATVPGSIGVVADAGLPADCAGASYTVAISGATTP
jgi:hypothetical protein